jgi:hypothetical protein
VETTPVIKMKKIFQLAVIAFIFWAIWHLVYFLSYKIFWSGDDAYVNQATGAFLGAFYASLFGLGGWWFGRLINRQKRGFDAMVRAEHLLNGYLNVIGDNRALVEGAVNSFERNKFHILSFSEYRINEDLLIDFTNIGLINELFDLNVDLRRHNNSAATLKEWMNRVEQGTLSAHADKINIPEHILVIKNECLQFLDGIELLNKKVERALCSTRVCLRKARPLSTSLFRAVFSKDHARLVEEELAKLQKEVDARKAPVSPGKK